jgi:hypothetical protein
MGLESTIQGLGLLKSAVKMVPVVGSNLEAAVDIIIQSCQIAKVRKSSSDYAREWAGSTRLQDVKTNKADWKDLNERAALCAATVARQLQRADQEARERRLADVMDLLRFVAAFLMLRSPAKPSLGSLAKSRTPNNGISDEVRWAVWQKRIKIRRRSRSLESSLMGSLNSLACVASTSSHYRSLTVFQIAAHMRARESLDEIVKSMNDMRAEQARMLDLQISAQETGTHHLAALASK